MANAAQLTQDVLMVLVSDKSKTAEQAATQVFEQTFKDIPPLNAVVRELVIAGMVEKARTEAERIAKATGILPIKALSLGP
jgi:hypothetical protein